MMGLAPRRAAKGASLCSRSGLSPAARSDTDAVSGFYPVVIEELRGGSGEHLSDPLL